MPSPRLLLLALVAPLALSPAGAQRPRDQDAAYKDVQRGKIMPIPRLVERARGHESVGDADYLGSEFDRDKATYRLKFVRGVRVIWVDVDARNGRVLQISGN